jgi:hypothetical protein
MRLILLGAAALLLAGCGGEEYPVPATEAFDTLASVGTAHGLTPLPVGFEEVSVDFSSVPDENFVRWNFSHEGDDLGTIFAQVKPNGDNASIVTVSYADGTAPDEKWRNGKMRGLLKRQVQRLVVEAVDSKFERRPFDSDLRAQVSVETASATMGDLFKDVDKSLDAEIARRKERELESASREVAYTPEDASKPMTDLSKYGN